MRGAKMLEAVAARRAAVLARLAWAWARARVAAAAMFHWGAGFQLGRGWGAATKVGRGTGGDGDGGVDGGGRGDGEEGLAEGLADVVDDAAGVVLDGAVVAAGVVVGADGAAGAGGLGDGLALVVDDAAAGVAHRDPVAVLALGGAGGGLRAGLGGGALGLALPAHDAAREGVLHRLPLARVPPGARPRRLQPVAAVEAYPVRLSLMRGGSGRGRAHRCNSQRPP